MKKLLLNSAVLSGAQITARALGFLFFLLLARLLAVSDFGLLLWTISFGYNFYPLADFGLERLALRWVARHPQETPSFLAKLLPLRLWLAVATVVITLLAAWLIGVRGQGFWLLFVFEAALIPANLLNIIGAVENGRERPWFAAGATLAMSFGSGLFSVLAAWWHQPLAVVLAGYLLAYLFLFGFLLLFYRLPHWSWRLDWQFSRQILGQAWVFAVLLVLAVFYLRLPIILVGRLLGNYWTGIYGAAGKFVEAGIVIPQGVAVAFFPLSARLLRQRHRDLQKLYLRLWLGLLLLALPLSAVFIFAGRLLVLILYGSRYLPAVPLFRILGGAIILFFVNALPGNIIHNSDRVKQFLPWAFSNFLVMLVGGWYLVAHWGVIGAAWAMVVGEAYGLLINNLFVYQILRQK